MTQQQFLDNEIFSTQKEIVHRQKNQLICWKLTKSLANLHIFLQIRNMRIGSRYHITITVFNVKKTSVKFPTNDNLYRFVLNTTIKGHCIFSFEKFVFQGDTFNNFQFVNLKEAIFVAFKKNN